MNLITDKALHDLLVVLLTGVIAALVLWLLVTRLQRSRPGFSIGNAVGIAFAVRVAAAGLVSLTSIAQSLRGGDELGFQAHASEVAHSSIGSGLWDKALTGELHVFNLAIQRYLLESPELALRMTQVGIAVVGLVLLAAAVYELAGPRASVIAMWLLALEPAGVFFSSLLHKEANMMLAIGLVAYGGTLIWRRAEPRYLLPIVAGCLVAVATRPYAGWFLIAAGATIVLHASIRTESRGGIRSLGLVALVVLFGAIAAPTVLEASSDESLRENLQESQEANARDSSNLKLEQVDFSNRTAVFRNLPRRSLDVLLRPYPWQLGNTSQGLAVLGTAFAYALIVLLISAAVRNRGQIMARAGPFVYLGLFLLVAYSLSAGNAGTAFRYRTQVVAIVICLLISLRKSEQRDPVKRKTAEGQPELGLEVAQA